MVRRVQSSGRTGWYYRVLRPGTARAGDPLRLDSRPYPDWPLRRLNRLLFDRVLSREALEPALQLPLVPSWRRLIERRLQQGDVRSEEHTSELQSLMRISYAVFCLKKKTNHRYVAQDNRTHTS